MPKGSTRDRALKKKMTKTPADTLGLTKTELHMISDAMKTFGFEPDPAVGSDDEAWRQAFQGDVSFIATGAK